MSANELTSQPDQYIQSILKMQKVIESLQKQLALKELLIDELTANNEDSNELNNLPPENIEKMMDTLLLNPQYTQIFLNRLQS